MKAAGKGVDVIGAEVVGGGLGELFEVVGGGGDLPGLAQAAAEPVEGRVGVRLVQAVFVPGTPRRSGGQGGGARAQGLGQSVVPFDLRPYREQAVSGASGRVSVAVAGEGVAG